MYTLISHPNRALLPPTILGKSDIDGQAPTDSPRAVKGCNRIEFYEDQWQTMSEVGFMKLVVKHVYHAFCILFPFFRLLHTH